jgi:hypothetical protein
VASVEEMIEKIGFTSFQFPISNTQKSSRSFCCPFTNPPSFSQYLMKRRLNRFVLTPLPSFFQWFMQELSPPHFRLSPGMEEIHKNVLCPGGGLISFLGIFLIPSLPAFKFRSLAKEFRRLSISVGGGGASDDGPAAGSGNEERDGNPFIYRRPW